MSTNAKTFFAQFPSFADRTSFLSRVQLMQELQHLELTAGDLLPDVIIRGVLPNDVELLEKLVLSGELHPDIHFEFTAAVAG